MEYTLWGLIKSSARLEITMPDSIRINHFESEKGLGSVGVIDGKQVYGNLESVCPEAENWPQCYREHDTISWSVEVSYMFILGEVVQYILVVLVFLGLAISRWRRRRKARKAASKSEKEAIGEKMLELELAAQLGDLEEKLAIENTEVFETESSNWWDQDNPE